MNRCLRTLKQGSPNSPSVAEMEHAGCPRHNEATWATLSAALQPDKAYEPQTPVGVPKDANTMAVTNVPAGQVTTALLFSPAAAHTGGGGVLDGVGVPVTDGVVLGENEGHGTQRPDKGSSIAPEIATAHALHEHEHPTRLQ